MESQLQLRRNLFELDEALAARDRAEARGLSPEGRTRLDEITRLIVEKLLLTPTEQLKSVGDGPMRVRYADALNRIFQLAAEHEDKVEDAETIGRTWPSPSERRLHGAIDVLQHRID